MTYQILVSLELYDEWFSDVIDDRLDFDPDDEGGMCISCESEELFKETLRDLDIPNPED